jgi:F0F1-type ATP synthase membrane subunit c/vacuolar-type H+-ATPase subunit K
MDRNLAILLVFMLCILGPAWVFAVCGKSSISALGRNPSSAPKIFTGMIIVLVFTEALAIVCMLIVFQLFG